MTDRGSGLDRAINLPLLVLYGLGTIVGAGIYALIGEIAGVAGYGAPAAFLFASIIAGFTACSFAELSARFPRAAGAALYVRQGFGRKSLALVVGLAVMASGMASAAALVNGFQGYLTDFVSFERATTILIVTLIIGAIAAWGIAESVRIAAAITLIEIGGLVVVIALGADALLLLPQRWELFLPGSDAAGWTGILLGITLSFYAFIGFEDMVDVAEEVKQVRRTMPIGILLTLGVATVLYVSLMTTALLTLTPRELAASSAPMSTLYAAHTGGEPIFIGVIALFAIINGALIQIIMASRVLYGLASRGQLPAVFARIHARTQTPIVATAAITAGVLLLALIGRLAGLATTTSLIMLCIFSGVNFALWRIKGRDEEAPPTLTFPRWLPLIGGTLSASFVIREIIHRL